MTKYFQNCLGVFQGGGCKGAAFVGAYKECVNSGVSFSEIVGASAGSIVAALVAAGATPKDLEEIIRSLDFNKFLKPAMEINDFRKSKLLNFLKKIAPKGLKPYINIFIGLGMFNSEYIEDFVETNLRKLLNLKSSIKFKDLVIPCSIISSDLKTNQAKIWSTWTTPDEEVSRAVRTSSNIPIFFQPVDKRYVDGGLLSNLPAYLYKDNDSIYDKILAFSLESDSNEIEIENIRDYFSALLNTALSGSLSIQLSMIKNIYYININTGSIKATDFKKINQESINYLIENGIRSTKNFFNNETALIMTDTKRHDVTYDYFDTYNIITHSCDSFVSEIIICDTSTKWVYELFPTIIKWKLFGSKIKVLIEAKSDTKDHGEFRQRFLAFLGINLEITEEIPFRGFIFDGQDNDGAKFILMNNTNDNQVFDSKFYYGEEDFEVINQMRVKANSYFKMNEIDFSISFKKMESLDDIFERLHNVRQYKLEEVVFSFIEIDIREVLFLTKFVRGYRYRQIQNLFEIFEKHNFELFYPIQLLLKNGKSTIITPPVIEKHGELLFVIEGNTRLTYLIKHGIFRVKIILVEHVEETLPSSGRYKYNQILITDKEKTGNDRYEEFDYSKYRDVEKAIRNPKTCLL